VILLVAGERADLEQQFLVDIQPACVFVDSACERGDVEHAEPAERRMHEPRPVGRQPDGEHERLVPLRRLDRAPIPPEAPGGRANPVGSRIHRRELQARDEGPLVRSGQISDRSVVVAQRKTERLQPLPLVFVTGRSEQLLVGVGQRQHRVVVLVFEEDGVAPGDPIPGVVSRRTGEALPQDRRRCAAGGDRRGEGDLCRIHELAEVHARKIERLADLVVAVPPLVLRQELLDPQAREMEEIAKGVFILLRRQAAVENAAGLHDYRRIGLVELGVERGENRGCFFQGWRLVGLRRHLAGRDSVVHPLPEPEALRIVQCERERVEVEAPLLRRRIVAFEAVVFEESAQVGLRRQRRHGCGRKGDEQRAEQAGETAAAHAVSSPVRVPVLVEKRSSSSPMCWSMLTNRLHKGVLFFLSNSRCCP